MRFKRCLQDRIRIEFVHVEGHAGHRLNEKADSYARTATNAFYPRDWCEIRCSICGNEYATAEDLAVHLKETHYRSNSEMEVSKERGVFACELCTRQLDSKRALSNHMLDKHQVILNPNGKTTISLP